MRIFLLIFCLLSTGSFAQQIDLDRLGDLLLEKVNRQREKKRVPPLSNDVLLDAPSKDHAKWMSQEEKLTHLQKEKEKRTPADRARFYKCPHGAIGENVQMQQLRPGDDVEELADRIFKAWKKSRGHYANMISEDFSRVSHQFIIKDGRLYACQVFGSEPPEYPDDFENADPTDIKDKKPGASCKRCDKILSKTHWHWFTRTPALWPGDHRVSGDSIFYTCPGWLYKRLFRGQASLGMDLVYHDQYPCGEANQLHGSPFYDGYYIGHRSKAELQANSRANPDGDIDIFMGMVPKSDVNYTPILNIYRANKPCIRVKLVEMPMMDLTPAMVLPQPDSKRFPSNRQELVNEDTMVVKLPYTRGLCELDEASIEKVSNTIASTDMPIVKVLVEGVSSMEGSSAGNEQLFRCRVENITGILPDSLKGKVETEFLENIDGLRYQLKEEEFKKQATMDEAALREWVNAKKDNPAISSMLDQTRKSTLALVTRSVEIFKDTLHPSLEQLEELIRIERYSLAELMLASLSDTLAPSASLRQQLADIPMELSSQSADLEWQRTLILARADSAFRKDYLDTFIEIARLKESNTLWQYTSEYAVMCELENPGTLSESFFEELELIVKQAKNKNKREVAVMNVLLAKCPRVSLRNTDFWNAFTNAAIRYKLPDAMRQVAALELFKRGNFYSAIEVLESGLKKTRDPHYLFRYLLLKNVTDGLQQDKDTYKVARNLARLDPELFCKLEDPRYLGTGMLRLKEWKELFCEVCKGQTD